MQTIGVKFVFENRTVEVSEKFLLNVVEFAVRSMFGAVGSSLIEYEVCEIDAKGQEMKFFVNKCDCYKLVAALAMVGSYGITRVKTCARVLVN